MLPPQVGLRRWTEAKSATSAPRLRPRPGCSGPRRSPRRRAPPACRPLGGPQGLRVQRLRLALRPGVGPGQLGQSASLTPAWEATSSSPARRWASEIPARALGDLRQEELRVHCTCGSGVRAEVEGQGQDGGVVIGHGSHLLP